MLSLRPVLCSTHGRTLWRRRIGLCSGLAICAYFGVVISCACEGANTRRVGEIVALIDSMPSWPFSPVVPDAAASADAIANAGQMEAIAHRIIHTYDVHEIREAMRVVAAGHSSKKEQRLFILNQFLFDIPGNASKNPRLREYMLSGFLATPRTVMTSRSWPWIPDEAGKLRFCIEAHGITRMGRRYSALEVFDAFQREFGVRPTSVDK